MKTLRIALAVFVFCLLSFVVIHLESPVYGEIQNVVNNNPILQSSASPAGFWDWVHQNWLVLALIASETAALLPTPISGIIQGVIKVIGSLIDPKK